MTPEEAIEIALEIETKSWTDFFSIRELIDNAKKQIPMKPLHIHKNYYCPICKEDSWIMWDDAVPNDMDNFCGICGQKIDWEGINNDLHR